jgi:hypothetical protein
VEKNVLNSPTPYMQPGSNSGDMHQYKFGPPAAAIVPRVSLGQQTCILGFAARDLARIEVVEKRQPSPLQAFPSDQNPDQNVKNPDQNVKPNHSAVNHGITNAQYDSGLHVKLSRFTEIQKSMHARVLAVDAYQANIASTASYSFGVNLNAHANGSKYGNNVGNFQLGNVLITNRRNNINNDNAAVSNNVAVTPPVAYPPTPPGSLFHGSGSTLCLVPDVYYVSTFPRFLFQDNQGWRSHNANIANTKANSTEKMNSSSKSGENSSSKSNPGTPKCANNHYPPFCLATQGLDSSIGITFATDSLSSHMYLSLCLGIATITHALTQGTPAAAAKEANRRGEGRKNEIISGCGKGGQSAGGG